MAKQGQLWSATDQTQTRGVQQRARNLNAGHVGPMGRAYTGARIRTRPKGMDNLCLFSAECVREVVAMWLYDFYYIVSVCIYRYSEIRNNKELDSTHSS